MCTPISHTPSRMRLMESASSKSLASAGSMVNVVTLVKSRRFFISDWVISSGICSAAASMASSKWYGRPYSASMACISALLSPAAPKRCTTRPLGVRLPWSHDVISTRTFSPSSASCRSRKGTNMSNGIFLESVAMNA